MVIRFTKVWFNQNQCYICHGSGIEKLPGFKFSIKFRMKVSIFDCLFYGFVTLKVKWLLYAYLSPDAQMEKSKPSTVNYSSFLNDVQLIEFPLLDKSNVKFEIQPKKCNHSMIVLVLSAPDNIRQRNILRRNFESTNNGEFFAKYF